MQAANREAERLRACHRPIKDGHPSHDRPWHNPKRWTRGANEGERLPDPSGPGRFVGVTCSWHSFQRI